MKWIKTILNTIVAIALLVATTGMTLNKHYCMGRLKAVAINETASPCTNSDGTPVQMPCCDDVSEELKIEEVTQISFDFDSSPELFELAIISWIVYDLSPIGIEITYPENALYAPPPPDIDFQVDHQVFLI